jgi:hypothetical protein
LLAKNRASAYKALEDGRNEGARQRQQEAYDLAMSQYGDLSVNDLNKKIAEWKEMRDREAAIYISASGGRMTEAQTAALVVYDGTLKALNDILAARREEERVIKAINDSLKVTEDTVVKVKSELSTINVGGADLSSLSAAPAINLDTFDQHLSESIGKTTAIADFREYWESLRKEAEKARSVGEEIATVISATYANMATAVGEGLGDLFTGGEFDPGKTFLEVLGKSLQQLGAALITYATAMESFKKSLSVIFKNPGLAIIAGIAAIATGKAFVNLANTPPKLASGGLAYGPTLAVVGDNRGAASDPEVIAPLSKLRNYMGGQQLELVGGVAFELRGDVARAILDRENMRLNRKG